MKPKISPKEKAQWTLERIDPSGFLVSEYMKGNIYISNNDTKTMTLLERDNPKHKEYCSKIDSIATMYTGMHIEVFHVIVGTMQMGSEDTFLVNYLHVDNDSDYYKENLERYSMVMAYVVNKAWTINEHGSIGIKRSHYGILRVS